MQAHSVKYAEELNKDLSSSNRLFSLATQAAQLGVWQENLVTGEIKWSDELYKMFLDSSVKRIFF